MKKTSADTNFSGPAAVDASTTSPDDDDDKVVRYQQRSTSEYRLVDVEPCECHGGGNGCVSIVTNCLKRIVCWNNEKSAVPVVQFPERLLVTVGRDGDVILKTSSPKLRL